MTEHSNEKDMVTRGAARYQRRVDKAVEAGRGSEQSRAGSSLVGLLTANTSVSLASELGQAVAGRRQAASVLLESLGADRCAAVGARVLVDLCAYSVKNQSLSRVVQGIGVALHDEAWLSAYADLKGARLLEAIKARNRESMFGTDKLRTLVKSQLEADEWTDWTKAQQIQCGTKVLSHLITASEMFTIATAKTGKTTKKWVEPTPGLLAMIRKQDLRIALTSPMYRPLSAPPVPWTDAVTGGYNVLQVPLVKGARGERLRALMNVDMPEVFEAINTIQNVKYAINEDVLVVASELWREGSTIAGLPMQDVCPKPEFPQDQSGMDFTDLTDEQKLVRKAWTAANKDAHTADRQAQAKSLSTRATLETATAFVGTPVYFPQQLDFRGRVYPMPQFNPQGDKLTKSLIRFADGKPITEKGAFWYRVHGANCFGLDKLSFAERVEWTYENQDRIIAMGSDPLGDTFWAEADEPWPFLAWALEFAEYVNAGPEFLSFIPVAVDATCSALQHWSAALRDEDGGRRVNLLDGNRGDVYADVAEELERALKAEGSPLSLYLLTSPYLGRKLVKTPTMARTYGGTLRGVEDHIRRHMQATDKLVSLRGHTDEKLSCIVKTIAGQVWEAINASLTGAKAGMDFTIAVGKVANALDRPMAWTTPAGFRVQTHYVNTTDRRVTTQLLGRVYKPRIREETEKTNKKKVVAAIAPNVIHSQDAAHLMKVVNGFTGDLVTIHDSFGTHASDVDALQDVLRQEFAAMYRGDFLIEWMESVIPPEVMEGKMSKVATKLLNELELPTLGTLDIDAVVSSTYAFS